MLHETHQTQAKASMGVPPNEIFPQNRTQGAAFLTGPHGRHSCQLGAAQKEVAVRGWHLRQPGGWGALVLLPGCEDRSRVSGSPGRVLGILLGEGRGSRCFLSLS